MRSYKPVTYGRTDGRMDGRKDGRTVMTKLQVFRFAIWLRNPKNLLPPASLNTFVIVCVIFLCYI